MADRKTLRNGQPRDTATTSRARELRRSATPPERLLWWAIRGRKIGGLKFRRQEPIGPYFADFCCRERSLIVEVDGMSHDDRLEYDRRRELYLNAQGFRVIRVTNQDVNEDLEAVVRYIAQMAGEPLE